MLFARHRIILTPWLLSVSIGAYFTLLEMYKNVTINAIQYFDYFNIFFRNAR